MSLSVKLIKLGNKIFKPVVHPFNLADANEMTYAEWQYEKGADTIAFFAEKYSTDEMFCKKSVLDIGCGAAGKSLYFVRMGAEKVTGIDIVESYKAEADSLAEKLGYTDRFEFVCASADALPYGDNSFDTIIMNDAMEHVGNPEAVLEEVMRVIKPDGRIYINFPPYYHPFGAHLSDAINMPWVHFFFSEKSCIKAYRELVAKYPDAADRLAFRFSTDEKGHEYISYINKMTISRFKKILKKMNISPLYYKEAPLRKFLSPFAKLPFLKELCVKMVVCVISKNGRVEKE